MKNFIILGLVAGLLFSVSAALSLWLNQSRQTVEAEKQAEKEKAAAKAASRNETKEPPDPRPPAKPDPGPIPLPDPAALGAGRDRANLERRAAQIELVVRDIQTQREVVDATLRQVMAELKTATANAAVGRVSELDVVAAELERQKQDMAASEKKNLDKMAALYDVMAPESAAPIMKQMAESGKMEMAARLLAKMKERQAAQVLAALSDPALAAQLLDKMRSLKAATPATIPAPAPPPAAGGAVLPARGP